MRKTQQPKCERMIVSLPSSLVTQVREFAAIVREGNKSGFVADAIRAYIDQLRKARHTKKLRHAYAASAEDSRAIAQQWEHLDDEAWTQLDKLTAKEKS